MWSGGTVTFYIRARVERNQRDTLVESISIRHDRLAGGYFIETVYATCTEQQSTCRQDACTVRLLFWVLQSDAQSASSCVPGQTRRFPVRVPPVTLCRVSSPVAPKKISFCRCAFFCSFSRGKQDETRANETGRDPCVAPKVDSFPRRPVRSSKPP